MRVVICGGGVIGACTAYFLARRGINVIVVERTEVAAAASGKAGGFLALDWCAGTPLDALARRSFGLHAALPGEIAGDWGYRRMTAYSGFVVRKPPQSPTRKYADRMRMGHNRPRSSWISRFIWGAYAVRAAEPTRLTAPREMRASLNRARNENPGTLFSVGELLTGGLTPGEGRLFERPIRKLTWRSRPVSADRACEQLCSEGA